MHINTLESKFTRHANGDYKADLKTTNFSFSVAPEDLETKSIEMLSLGSYQMFGVPFPVKQSG